LEDKDYREKVKKFNDVIGKNAGEIIKVDEWGTKTLAYRLKKFDKGAYVLLQYCCEPDLINKLHRDLRLDDKVLKYQTIKLSNQADPKELKQRLKDKEKKPEVEAESPAVEETPKTASQKKTKAKEKDVDEKKAEEVSEKKPVKKTGKGKDAEKGKSKDEK
jgi:small subunit ribosomal protein S6